MRQTNSKKVHFLHARLYCFTLAILLLAGCMGFSVRVRTVVDQREACLRQIDYTGQEWERFLLPASSAWKITRIDSGATAIGEFEDPNDIGQDLIFDASQEIEDQKWLEYVKAKNISTSKSEAIRITNNIHFKRRNYFFWHQYTYTESFNKNLVVDYLKYEYFDKPVAAGTDSADLRRHIFGELYQQMYMYQITCAVRLPGQISSTNADYVEQQVAIWEISLGDFVDESYENLLHISSRRYLITHIVIGIIVSFIISVYIAALLIRRIRQRKQDPFYRLRE